MITRVILCCLFALTVLHEPQAADRKKPNIVFFIADDLGQRDLGCYGSTFYETPNIDRIAREGAKFTDAYAACPVCSPTRASILTGQWPQRTGVTDYISTSGVNLPEKWKRNTKLLPAPNKDRLALDAPTLAKSLKAGGYATFFAGKWHLGPEGFWPENQGFDYNFGGYEAGHPSRGNKYFSPYDNPRLSNGPEGEHLDDRLASEAVKFIEANKERPFLAYFPFYLVHTPLMAHEALQQKYEEKRRRLGLEPKFAQERDSALRVVQEHAVYAAMIETMDTAVGKILAVLDKHGLRDNTIVIFTSDNGGLSTAEGSPTSNLPLRAGKGWMYEGGVRVPLVIRWPAEIAGGTLVSAPASSPDFFPTLLDAADLKPARGQTLDGVSLLPVLKGKKLRERSLFWHYPHYGNQGGAPGAVIRKGDWKLIEWMEDNEVELFNLADDIGEKTNLATKEPKRVAKLQAELHAWQKEVGAQFPTPNSKYDPQSSSQRKANRK